MSADPQDRTIADSPPAGVADESQVVSVGHKCLAGRYELVGMLGSGGMGTVYRAFDRELEETVALKVLKGELVSTEMLERFRREVKLARKVTHKNVARTFDIGEDDGNRFLTMEFIDGEMLAARLARRRRLPPDEVCGLARDICAGLAAAHAVGVVHRDLKPANVIVAADGSAPGNVERAVITDFGVARALEGAGESKTVGLVGTPRYMSPEQVDGALDVDARADLYALGVMLYELLTGTHAWTGDGVIAMAAARLLRPPPDPRAVVPDLPAPLAELVLRLMSRRREDRPASAGDVLQALDAFAPAAAPAVSGVIATVVLAGARAARPGARVVAVLPIINLGTKDDDYLVDGVLDDLVDLLSVVAGLAVRPRGETLRFADPSRDVRAAGRAVGADVVVDASFRRIGGQVRVSFRLIAVEDGFQLWAQRFDRAPAEVLTIADDAAAAIASHLTAKVDAEKRARAALDPDAEDAYLRARHLMRKGWPEYNMEARTILGRARERVPEDTRITGAYAVATARSYGSPPFGIEAAEEARAVAERTLEKDARNADARVALGTLHHQNLEADAAVRLFRQALAIAPNCIDAHDWLGRIMGEVGRPKEGIALLRRAIAIAPEHVVTRYQIARIASVIGDTETMLETLGALPVHPGEIALWFVVQARDAVYRRDRATAERLFDQLRDVPNLTGTARHAAQQILGVAAGKRSDVLDPAFVEKVLPVDATFTPRRASFHAQLRAEVAGSLDRMDMALDALRLADGNAFVDIVWLDHCPLFDPLREADEFKALRERVAMRARRVVEVLELRSATLA